MERNAVSGGSGGFGGSGGTGTPPERLRLVVLGGGGVGKSALSVRFVQSYFVPDYDPTIEDSYSTLCSVDGVPARLDIVDTAGQEGRGSPRERLLRAADGFLLVFAIDDRRSFQLVPRLLGQILRVKDRDDVPAVLLGNKVDLQPHRQVGRDEAQAFARRSRLRYLETSARTRLNVDEAFEGLVRDVRRFQEQQKPPPPPPRPPPREKPLPPLPLRPHLTPTPPPPPSNPSHTPNPPPPHCPSPFTAPQPPPGVPQVLGSPPPASLRHIPPPNPGGGTRRPAPRVTSFGVTGPPHCKYH